MMLMRLILLSVIVFGLFASGTSARQSASDIPGVTVMRVPDGGVQPEIAVDGRGIVHLIYHTGEPGAADIRYRRSSDGGKTFSDAIRVNTTPGSAIATGGVRGAQLAVGKDGRVHVAWNGSSRAQPRGPNDATPLLYTRLNDEGTAFEPERNVIASHYGLDGGSSIAADREGNVYIIWHAPLLDTQGEQSRRVWVARSSDGGATFGAERLASKQSVGACGCCGLTAFTSTDSTLFVFFRTANQMVHRDMHLLVSSDRGETFREMTVDKWEIGQCVMSTSAFAESNSDPGSGIVVAWETERRIRFGQLDLSHKRLRSTIEPAKQGRNAKHPTVAINRKGYTLVAWTEETAWAKGGRVAWQLCDPDGRQLLEGNSSAPDLPVWGSVSSFGQSDGAFVIIY